MRWGVMGTGGIAAKFAADAALLDDVQLVAVGSRRPGGAQEFAEQFGVPHRFEGPGGYRELAQFDQVDAVYVATPHPFHAEHGLLAIAAGKHVLIEKPFAMDARQGQALADAATARGVFCMEAMWTRFLPHMVRIRELLADEAIGSIRLVHADQGMWFEPDPQHRLFAPELGGGALLDLGIYPFSFASMVLGSPDQVLATMTPAMTGVDLTTSAVLHYADGAQAVLTCTAGAQTPMRAFIAGTHGRIEIGSRWFANAGFRLIRREGAGERFEAPEGMSGMTKGMRFEIAEADRCISAGLMQSPVMPLAESVSILATMDDVRQQIGLRYPGSDE